MQTAKIMILIVVVPALIEAINETLKMCAVKSAAGKWSPNWGFLWKIAVSIAICYAARFDLIEVLGVNLAFTLGILATGILCGRGANFVHELYKRIAGGNASALLPEAIGFGVAERVADSVAGAARSVTTIKGGIPIDVDVEDEAAAAIAAENAAHMATDEEVEAAQPRDELGRWVEHPDETDDDHVDEDEEKLDPVSEDAKAVKEYENGE